MTKESIAGIDLGLMLEVYAEMKAELQPALDRIKAVTDKMLAEIETEISTLAELERNIKEHSLNTGEVASAGGWAVSIRKGYTRRTWPDKLLTGYAAAHPEIEQFCKVTEIGPSAVIKVTK